MHFSGQRANEESQRSGWKDANGSLVVRDAAWYDADGKGIYFIMNVFIALDGLDGTGKSTQQRLLCDWLRQRGHDVVACRDPGTTPLGERIRTVLLANDLMAIDRRAEMLLYMAARAQLVDEVITPALAAGKTVVSDRYLLANIVYQGYAGGLDPAEIWRVGQVATGGLLPKLVVVLDMPVAAAAGRIGRERDRMEEQGDDF